MKFNLFFLSFAVTVLASMCKFAAAFVPAGRVAEVVAQISQLF